jgi:hypothetical protein
MRHKEIISNTEQTGLIKRTLRDKLSYSTKSVHIQQLSPLPYSLLKELPASITLLPQDVFHAVR